MKEAVIVSTARTPIGKAYRGAFNNTDGADMGAHNRDIFMGELGLSEEELAALRNEGVV